MRLTANVRIFEVRDADALDYYRGMGRSAVGEAVVEHPERGPMSFAMVTDCDWEALPLLGYLAEASVAPYITVAVQ
jgi:hypothetical protein